MKIAYLILAHQQPNQLGRLVGALRDKDTKAFVHIDRSVSEEPFREAVREADPTAVFLSGPRRIRVHWAHVSVVEATLNLIETAAGSPTVFDRYVLLSGADYPLQSNSRIRETLSSEAEFMRMWNAARPETREAPFVSDYHLMDKPFGNPRSPAFARIDQKVLRRLWRFWSGRLPKRPLTVEGLPLVQGSQWWALTGPCIDYIRDFNLRNPDYLRHFRYAAASDEFFFHSIVGASPFGRRLSRDLSDNREASRLHGIHYIDWRGRSRGAWSPRILRETDLPAIDASGALFARKFDEERSAPLLDIIDRRRRTDSSGIQPDTGARGSSDTMNKVSSTTPGGLSGLKPSLP